MQWYFGLLYLFGFAVSGFYFSKARRYLSEEGEKHIQDVYSFGLFAPREYYSELGWKYWKRGLITGAGNVFLIVLIVLILRFL